MPKTKLLFMLLCAFPSLLLHAQKKTASVSGRVLDENENPLGKVNITILGRSTGIAITTDSGTFAIKVPSDKAFALVFSHTGYKNEQRNFLLSQDEEEKMTLRME